MAVRIESSREKNDNISINSFPSMEKKEESLDGILAFILDPASSKIRFNTALKLDPDVILKLATTLPIRFNSILKLDPALNSKLYLNVALKKDPKYR